MKRLFLIFLLLIIAVPCFGGQTLKRHLEPETVNYFSLPSSSGDQFTLNEQIKLIKYNNGSVTLSGLTANFSNATGFQFVSNPSVDLRKWIGYYITFTSSAGNTLKVKVSAAGTGETLGDELVDAWTNNTSYPYETWTAGAGNLVTQAINNAGAGVAYKDLGANNAYMLYKCVNTTTKASGTYPLLHLAIDNAGTSTNDQGFTVNGTSYANTRYLNGVNPRTGRYLVWENASATDFAITAFSLKQVFTPSATGIYFTDPQVVGTFNYNAASYTAVITKD